MSRLSKTELKEALDELGIEYELDAKNAELEALLADAPETVEEAEEALEEDEEEVEEEELPKEDFGSLAGKKIVAISDTTVSGREFLSVTLSDNSTTILSKEDLEKQRS